MMEATFTSGSFSFNSAITPATVHTNMKHNVLTVWINQIPLQSNPFQAQSTPVSKLSNRIWKGTI